MHTKNSSLTVNNVSKIYRLGVQDSTEDSLAKTFAGFIKSPLDNFKKYRSLYTFDDVDFDNPDNPNNDSNVLWAVNNVSFEVQPGEVVGIIGRNGAGKSTLLKLLSRITPPTKGSIEIRGRISSLLEVGTGFHPELTGRENVYLNGTILGMKKREVDRKFDEIVAFSAVEKFLDTPVKRYSSGMRVRLAFAVAAHLEPEILIIDEVLAVGDATFQRKCLSKMEDVGGEGRTVLFVSHSMPAITRLCPRTILLDSGKLFKDGPTHEVVSAYLHSGLGTTAAREWRDPATAPRGDVCRLTSAQVRNEAGAIADTIDIRNSIGLEMEYEVLKPGYVLMPHFHVHNEEGIQLFSTFDVDPQWRRKPRPVGKYKSCAWVPGNFFSEGTVYVSVGMITLEPNLKQFNEPEAIAFQILDSHEGDSARGEWVGDMGGVVRPLLKWSTDVIKE